MSDIDKKSKNGNELIPFYTLREWKFLYFEPGRPGLEDGNGHMVYHRGLCKYCGLWQTCTESKPESGVWRCSHFVPWQELMMKEELHES